MAKAEIMALDSPSVVLLPEVAEASLLNNVPLNAGLEKLRGGYKTNVAFAQKLESIRFPPRCVIWFPQEVDWHWWRAAVGAPEQRRVFLKMKGPWTRFGEVELQVFTGIDSIHDLRQSRPDTVIVHISPEGVSDKRFKVLHKLQVSSNHIHFAGIFSKQDLLHYPREQRLVSGLLRQIRELSDFPPFLGIDEQVVPQTLSMWLSNIVAQTYLDALTRLFEVAKHDRYTPALDVLDYIKEKMEVSIHRLASESCRQTGQASYGSDFRLTIGEELSPALHQLLLKLTEFAGQLDAADIPDFKDLSAEIVQIMQNRPPILALIGSFSSGKTTLLNALLLGKDKTRAFRTGGRANTAIVSEIHAVEAGGKEEARLYFRDRVDHVLGEIGEDGREDASLDEHIRCLLDLLETGVLTQEACQLHEIQQEQEPGSGQSQIEQLSAKEILTALIERKLFDLHLPPGKLTFSAKVNQSRLEELRKRGEIEIPEYLDLTTQEAWEQMQGDQTASDENVLESSLATFLVQRAEVHLHNPLLKLTSIADTPGTGSLKDRHDFITDEYLHRAEGFILLLPTNRADAERVLKSLLLVRDELSKRYDGNPARGLGQVAFIVNCFASFGEKVALKKVDDLQEMIYDIFGLTASEWKSRQRDPQRTNFFVVKLKHVEEGQSLERLYNYPSLGLLKTWIEQLFTSYAYTERFYRAIRVLDKDWNDRYNRLDSEYKAILDQTKMFKNSKEKIRSFRESELESITAYYCWRIDEIKNKMRTARQQIDIYLDNYVADPYDRNRPISWRSELKSYYEEINSILASARDENIAASWINAMKEELPRLNIRPPAFVEPDPLAQRRPWGPHIKLNIARVDEKFDEIDNNLPDLAGQIWYWVANIWGGKDIRTTLAEDVRDNFWPQQYETVNQGLQEYLRRCEEFICAKACEIQERCLEAEQEVDSSNTTRLQALQTTIDAFPSFDKKRRELIKEVRDELSQRI